MRNIARISALWLPLVLAFSAQASDKPTVASSPEDLAWTKVAEPAKGTESVLWSNPETGESGAFVHWKDRTTMPSQTLDQDLHVVVLTGTFTLEAGGQYKEIRAGGFASIPRGIAHKFGCENSGECQFVMYRSGRSIRVPAAADKLAFETNWQAPVFKTHAQALIERVFAEHRELESMTFNGSPPGTDVYTMFAGTYSDRIGKAAGAEDMVVHDKRFTIIGPNNKADDPVKKFKVIMPLRDAQGRDIGALVLNFKDPAGSGAGLKGAADYLAAATAIRDGLKASISSHAALFKPAR